MKIMKKIFSTNNLFLLTTLCLPLYLVRLNIFGLPTNIFELLVMTTIVTAGIKNKNALLAAFLRLPKLLIMSLFFIFSGLLFSLLSNDAYKIGLGVFKGWFLIPFLFSFVLYVSLKKESFLEKIYLCLYFSALMVGLISLGYKLLGIVTYDNRLQAFYPSPNYLAMFLAPGIFFGVYFLIKYALQKKTSYFLFSAFSLIFLMIALYLTYSYGAWISVSGSILIMSLAIASNKKIAALAIALAMLFSFLIFQTNAEKFSGIFSERSSLASRLTIWKSSSMMLKESPVLGIGPGNFQNKYLEFQKYFPPYLEWAVPQPHNLFLAFWLQSGLLGLMGFLSLLFFIFKKIFEVIKNKKDALLVAPLLGFFIYTILHGLIDTPYWKNDLSFLFWVCIFLTFSAYNTYKQNLKNTIL